MHAFAEKNGQGDIDRYNVSNSRILLMNVG